MQKPLEVVYELTADDLHRLHRHKQPTFGWRSVAVFLVVYLGLAAINMLPTALRTGDWKGLAGSVAVGFICGAGIWFVLRLLRNRKPNDPESTSVRRITRIVPDKFEHDDSVSMTAVQWKGFTKLDSDDVLLYFLMADKSAYIIPKRAFSSLEDAEAFYQTAWNYWQSAQNGTPAPPPTRSSAWPPPPGR